MLSQSLLPMEVFKPEKEKTKKKPQTNLKTKPEPGSENSLHRL